jgi:hypothetical protein
MDACKNFADWQLQGGEFAGDLRPQAGLVSARRRRQRGSSSGTRADRVARTFRLPTSPSRDKHPRDKRQRMCIMNQRRTHQGQRLELLSDEVFNKGNFRGALVTVSQLPVQRRHAECRRVHPAWVKGNAHRKDARIVRSWLKPHPQVKDRQGRAARCAMRGTTSGGWRALPAGVRRRNDGTNILHVRRAGALSDQTFRTATPRSPCPARRPITVTATPPSTPPPAPPAAKINIAAPPSGSGPRLTHGVLPQSPAIPGSSTMSSPNPSAHVRPVRPLTGR